MPQSVLLFGVMEMADSNLCDWEVHAGEGAERMMVNVVRRW